MWPKYATRAAEALAVIAALALGSGGGWWLWATAGAAGAPAWLLLLVCAAPTGVIARLAREAPRAYRPWANRRAAIADALIERFTRMDQKARRHD